MPRIFKMSFNAYFSKQTKRRNSTAAVGATGTTIPISLKDDCSIKNPALQLHLSVNPTSYNYVYISEWGLGYFIDNWEWHDTDWIARCSIDALGSYRSAILATSAYVKYSDSAGNDKIVDNRISGEYINTFSLLDEQQTFWSAPQQGQSYYVLRCIGETGGLSGFVLLKSEFDYLAEQLGAELDFDTTATIQMSDALGCVVGAMEFPIHPTGTGSKSLYLGTFDTGISAPVADHFYSSNVVLTWTRYFNDWRDSVFIDYVLWLPFVGAVQLSSSDVGQLSSLGVYFTIDWQGGGILYKIYAGNAMIATYAGMVGNSVPVTGYMGNAIGAVAGAISAAGSALGAIGQAAAGNAAGAVGSGFSGLSAAATSFLTYKKKTATVIGGTTGCAYVGRDARTVGLYAIITEPTDLPANIKPVLGLPCMKILSVGSCTGFLMTDHFSVTGCDAPADVKDEINRMLDEGVYIE